MSTQKNMPTQKKENILLLLVEDDLEDYILTRELLEIIFGNQFQLDWAPTCELAKEFFSRNVHHLCLLDCRMGPADGMELLKNANELGFHSPIIILTGHEDPATDALAQKYGAVDYLYKNKLTPKVLARAIRYALSRREMEIERLERIKAETENQSKNRFLANLSHELRTPLAAILGYTDVMLAEPLGEKNHQSLLAIKRNGQHLRSLLNDMLDLSKIDTNKLELEINRVKLNPFLAELYAMMEVFAQKKNLTLDFFSLDAIPEHIQTDSVRLRQILINLLNNAIKFSVQGTIRLQLRMIMDEDREKLCFEVIDQGPVIPEADRKKLFQPFVRLNNKIKPEGSGLGLAISRQLARRLGGDITFAPNPEGGNIFRAVVSADTDPGEPRRILAPGLLRYEQEQIIPYRVTGRILVVDDNTDLRHLIKLWLEPTGAHILEADNGQSAIDLVQQAQTEMNPVTLILMDIQMPLMDGHTASQRLRKMGFDIPIIALTAIAMKGEKEVLLESGCNDFLSKPFTQQQLLDLIRPFTEPPAGLPTLQSGIHRKLMIVEDHQDAAQAAAQLLEFFGWQVAIADCVENALTTAENFQPDLILMDLNLPDGNGLDLAPQLRKKCRPSVRIVLMSGSTPSDAECVNFGIDHSLLKPVELESLKNLSSLLPA